MASAPAFVKGKVPRALCRTGFLLLFSAAPIGLRAQENARFDYSSYARVLARTVSPRGHVRYAELKQDRVDLDLFLQRLAAVSPENRPTLFPDPAAKMAYWINAYNAFVLQAVAEAYPVASVRDMRFGFGLLFFKREAVSKPISTPLDSMTYRSCP